MNFTISLGDGAVGLTSMLRRYLYGTWTDEYIPTVIDFYKNEVVISKEKVNVEFCDTPGQEDYSHIRIQQYKKADGNYVYILCL